MLKASIQGELNETDLYVEIVSADNEKQTGDYFNAFIELANKNKDKIKKLVIVDTSFLHRHYDNKYSNETAETEWFKSNKKHLNLLEIPYTYTRYSKIVKSKFYDPHYKAIKTDYSGDENGDFIDNEFRRSAKVLSDKFIEKGTLRDIIKFILDETAGYLAIIEYFSAELISETKKDPANLNMVLSYPGGFNECITHASNKYKLYTTVNYEEKSYRFRGKLEIKTDFEQKIAGTSKELASAIEKNNERRKDYYSPTFFSRSLAYHIDLIGIEPQYHPIFSIKLITFCNEFKEEVNTNGSKYKHI